MADASGKVEFIAYCLEEFKDAERLTGKAAIRLFEQYRVMDYLASCYGALHSTGGSYIVNDIREFIDARRQDEKR
jgi:hypothetical protein